VAMATKFSASEAAEAYYFLASAGFDAQQSMAALPQVARFAQAGMFDLSLATDLATDAQSALGLTVSDAQQNLENLTRVTDVLVKANTLANASVQQFSEALTNKAGAAMRAVGMDMEEGVAVLAAFADQGIKSAEAGTQFAIVMRDLQTKAIENAAAFAANGVAVFDSAGELRNMADIVSDLETRLSGMSDAARKATLMDLGFSDRSISALQALLGTSDKIRQYEEELRKAGGTTKEVADKQLPTFTRGWKELKTVFERLSVVMITPLLEALGVVLGWVAKGLNVVVTWLEVLREQSMALGEALGDRIRGLLGTTATETERVGKAAEGAAPKVGDAADAARRLNEVVGDTPEVMATASEAVRDFIASMEGDLEFRGLHSLERRLEEMWRAGEFEVKPGYVDFEQYDRARKLIDELMGLERDMAEFERRTSEHQALMGRGARLTESLMTPMEAYEAKQADLRRLLEMSAIDWQTYTRAIAEAREELERMANQAATASSVGPGTQACFEALDRQRSRLGLEKQLQALPPPPVEPVKDVGRVIPIEPMVEIEPEPVAAAAVAAPQPSGIDRVGEAARPPAPLKPWQIPLPEPPEPVEPDVPQIRAVPEIVEEPVRVVVERAEPPTAAVPEVAAAAERGRPAPAMEPQAAPRRPRDYREPEEREGRRPDRDAMARDVRGDRDSAELIKRVQELAESVRQMRGDTASTATSTRETVLELRTLGSPVVFEM
nr:phage tail tape measure protein [Vicinamibacterales bacterium]